MQKTKKLAMEHWRIGTCPICETDNKAITYRMYVYMDKDVPIAYTECCKECAVLEGI